MSKPRIFLVAQWRWLVMLNFTIDPHVLAPFVPHGLELDTFQGQHYVSIVGFQFLNTRVKGISIPCHVNFDELNLRFYVKRTVADKLRRGVTFIKEIAPRAAVCWVAKRLYNENYVTMAMRHKHEFAEGHPRRLQYEWRHAGNWEHVSAITCGEAHVPHAESEETFITEHYWGYTAQRNGGTLEYRVDHPRWQVWQAREVEYKANVARLYGSGFAEALAGKPSSAFVADGSEVQVHGGEWV